MDSDELLQPAVFLDRDGVINVEKGFIWEPEEFELAPGAVEALVLLRSAGYKLIVVTNQSGIGRGLYTEAQLAEVHAHMESLLKAGGAWVDGIYFAPDHPDSPTEHRKPGPGMLLEGARDHGIDLRSSVMVGDQVRDAEAGQAAGCVLNILVPPGAGDPRFLMARDLTEAAGLILDILGPERGTLA